MSGTGQRELKYAYDVSEGRMRTTVRLADDSILSQTLENGFGETVVEAGASTTGFIYTRSEYNNRGQLTRSYKDTGAGTTPTASTLYEYDSFGNVTRQVLALDEEPSPLNSPVEEFAYGVEDGTDGVYSVTTRTRYNAAGTALTSTRKELISSLSSTLAEKSVAIDERGLTSTEWTEYGVGTVKDSYSSVPTSSITAHRVMVDGFTVSQSDHAGVASTQSRHFTETGLELTRTDGRGNATTTVTDIAGRTVSVTDAAGNTTSTAYNPYFDEPSVVTDACGKTACYKYDFRGRKVAEWGTAIQPACFGYDDADRMTSLTTFRAGTETITTDPSSRTDGDVTTWAYHATTGLEVSKTYADGKGTVKTYDAFNRLSTETDAREKVKTCSYEHARGLLLEISYSDSTTAESFVYNHLGQITQVTDDAGVRSIGYNTYGERETDSLLAEGVTHLVTETRDSFGRSSGYSYAKNGNTEQTVTTAYGTDGRISGAGFIHGGQEKQFAYAYLQGTHLLQTLTKPNGMTLTQSYESHRDLLTQMDYHRGDTLVARRAYQYDTLGRPTSRTLARQGATRNDVFTYNNRSELISDVVDGTGLNGWDYDNIGNRRMEQRMDGYEIYTANQLNQYTAIEDQEGTFSPTYDDDGNQTRIKTSTGIWNVTYNAKNRPVLFTKDDNSVSVACTYDYMGRRATKVVTENGVVTTSHRFLYRGYLQIACCDRTRANHPCLWLITWDPTQPVATRPLAIQKDGTWYTYGWDLTKNIWETYTTTGYIGTAYTYSAYGQVTASGSITQPIQWSSEYNDTELALVYYNYRHYNPIDGRWIGRDRIRYWDYVYARNSPCHFSDYNGLYEKDSDNINCIGYCNDKTHNLQPKESSLKETMEGEGWTCIPSKRGDDCSSEDTHTHDIMALFIYVKEVGHKMRRQQKQTKLSDPNDIESKPIELIQDFYEIEKLKPNNANFWSVAKDILDEYGITNMYDAKNIWDWDFESIPRYAAIKEQLKLNQIMDFDYHGVLKESPNNWSYVSCMQPKDHYKVEEAPNLRFFENEEMIEKYCCYRKKGNCK